MSDFDAFESSEQPQNVEEDPAAAFLAREQTELAGLEDDNFGDDNSAPQDQGMTYDFNKNGHLMTRYPPTILPSFAGQYLFPICC